MTFRSAGRKPILFGEQGRQGMSQRVSSSSLNGRLGPRPKPERRSDPVGIRWDATAIRSSAPPVRIVGGSSRYQGGYRLNI